MDSVRTSSEVRKQSPKEEENFSGAWFSRLDGVKEVVNFSFLFSASKTIYNFVSYLLPF